MRALLLLLTAWLALVAVGQSGAENGCTSTQFIQGVHRAPVNLQLFVTSFTPGQNQPITFMSAISGVAGYPPTGTVRYTATSAQGKSSVSDFYPLNSANGVDAAWTTPLPAGLFAASVFYSGDSNYLPQTESLQRAITVGPPDFSLSTNVMSVVQGQTANLPLTVIPLNGFSGVVHFNCDSEDPTIHCDASQPSATIPAASTASVIVNIPIMTYATSVTAVGGLLLVFFLPGYRRPGRRWMALFAACFATLLAGGCGAAHFIQHDGTPLGRHTINIIGTSGSITHTEMLTIMVVKK